MALLVPANLFVVGALLAHTQPLPQSTRRDLLKNALMASTVALPLVASAEIAEWQDERWATLGLRGTSVPLRSIESAAQADSIGQMGLYPDPLLRRIGSPVSDFGPAVAKVADLLVADMKSNAITALQYGVDARIIALKGAASPRPLGAPIVFCNPTILQRSAEYTMRPWREVCLVLPPGLEVELLRDDVVEVRAQDVNGTPFSTSLSGEAARAFQHEYRDPGRTRAGGSPSLLPSLKISSVRPFSPGSTIWTAS